MTQDSSRFAAHAVNDVVAFLPLLRELEDQFGGILKVAIQLDHGIPARLQVGGQDRALITKVS